MKTIPPTATTVQVFLEPADFKDTYFVNASDCPLSRAAKRLFNADKVKCSTTYLRVWADGNEYPKHYRIVDEFDGIDYGFVKDQYENPKCDTEYYVTLQETTKEDYETNWAK